MNKHLLNTYKNLSYCDDSYEEYRESLLAILREANVNFSTHAMSDHALFLLGQKDMLEEIINLIEEKL